MYKSRSNKTILAKYSMYQYVSPAYYNCNSIECVLRGIFAEELYTKRNDHRCRKWGRSRRSFVVG